MRKAAAGVLAVAVCLALAGCSPTYVLRAGYEEAKILWRREPMARVLARPDLDPDWRRKIELVLEVREFAKGLGLDVGGSFASLSYIDGDHNIFVVTAAKPTELEPFTWWFPIVGRVPYKGYFARTRADAEAAVLAAQGYDTHVRGAAAFSTLGWFDDPLLRHLLRHDENFIVNLVLHELYHNTFYATGPRATAFNESLANFVGHRGAIAFFTARPEQGARAVQAVDQWEDERRFAGFIADLAARLRTAYAAAPDRAAALAAREGIFAAARADFGALPFHGRELADFPKRPLNNAIVLNYLLYTTRLDMFEEILRREGDLASALRFIEDAAKRDRRDPFAGVAAVVEADERHDHSTDGHLLGFLPQ